MKNIPTLYMESLLCFVGVFLENIFKNLKTVLNIYGKLGVKSFTFLYDLSNESQNIIKKRLKSPNTQKHLWSNMWSCLNNAQNRGESKKRVNTLYT